MVFSGSGMLFAGRSGRALSIVAGSVLVVLGLNTIFDFLRFLGAEVRARVVGRPTSAAGAMLVGMAFGAGWTPCVGPILASILFMAARSGGVAKAALLLSVYSAGLALPFIAAGLFFERLAPLWAWFKRHGRGVKTVSGALLVVIGLSMALGRMTAFNAAAFRLGFLVRSLVVSNPGMAKAWSVGLMAALAAALALPPLILRHRFATPARLALLGIIAALAILELAGIVSIAGAFSGWLLF
jgi:cytochrome c-type biogenesis protein